MSDLLNSLLLAIIQGLTEFLPVSSSGHLVLFQRLLGTREGDLLFDVVLHCGTLGSVLLVYRREVGRLLQLDGAARRYLGSLAVGTLPAAVVGLLAKGVITGLFGRPLFAAGGLVLTAGLLFSTRFARRAGAPLPEPWQPRALPPRQALTIGLAQALAILPGISRSGATIAASLWAGLARAEAARFSFLLSVPTIGGALLLQLLDGGAAAGGGQLATLLAAALAAFAVGLLALRWTALAVVQAHFWKFSIYCLMAGILAAALLL